MPKLIHRKPKYRKHATGLALVTLGGKDIYLGKHNSTKSRREYDRLIAEWEANNRTIPAAAASDDYSVAELLAMYWKHAQVYFAVASGDSDGELCSIRMVLRVMKRLYADTDSKDFGPLALRAVRDAMVAEGWSRKYVNGQVNRIRRVFKWGVEHEVVSAPVWMALKAVEALKEGKTDAKENAPIVPVDDIHVDATLPWLPRQVQAIVKLLRITGARPSEIMRMRGDLIIQKKDVWEYSPLKHKTQSRGHGRVIFLNAAAQKIVKPFVKLGDPSAYLFSPADAEAERRAAMTKARKTPLSSGNRPGSNRRRKPRRSPGVHYTATSLYQCVTRACDWADAWAKGGKVIANDARKVDRWTPYQIRHTVGTEIREKYDLESVQAVLGQKTVTAAQIYAEKSLKKARQIMMEGA